MTALLLKVLHIVAVVAWFAGLLYLPRLFVYHSECADDIGRARFCRMESRLYWRIMLPAMAAVLVFGLLLIASNYHAQHSAANGIVRARRNSRRAINRAASACLWFCCEHH